MFVNNFVLSIFSENIWETFVHIFESWLLVNIQETYSAVAIYIFFYFSHLQMCRCTCMYFSWKKSMFICGVYAVILTDICLPEPDFRHNAAKYMWPCITWSNGMLPRKLFCWEVFWDLPWRIWHTRGYLEQWNEVSMVWAVRVYRWGYFTACTPFALFLCCTICWPELQIAKHKCLLSRLS